MLVREVCMSCVSIKASRPEHLSSEQLKWSTDELGESRSRSVFWREWNEEDDDNWKKGCVYCRMISLRGRLSAKTSGSPPEWCPFVVEHVVLEKSDGCANL